MTRYSAQWAGQADFADFGFSLPIGPDDRPKEGQKRPEKRFPYCCDVQWDEICAAHAYKNCPLCVGEVMCPGATGSCCSVTLPFTPACADLDCCILVCSHDYWCCGPSTFGWDGTCAQHAQNLCNICLED